MPENSATLDRTTLVDSLGVRLKTGTLEARDTSIRVGVDKKLARLFGAKLFLGYDWNVFSKPKYTLEEIEVVLTRAGIEVSAQDLVGEHLRVNGDYKDYYFFREIVRSQGHRLYCLTYNRQFRVGNDD